MKDIDSVKKQVEKSKIVVRKVEDLLPYARNSRAHSDSQINQIAASIKEFGFTNPVLIKENGEIIAGHGRVLAAMRLKITEVPCIVLGHLSDTQARAYVLADNQLALNSSWDQEMLGLELQELQGLDFDLDLIGFDEKFLTDKIEQPDEPQPEDPEQDSEKELILRIVFENEDEQQALFLELRDRGFKVKV